MIIRLWGVRGSTPTPLSPEEVRGKISMAIEQAKPSDLTDQQSKKKFVEGLAPEIYGTTGSNTTCIEIRSSLGDCIVFDAGSGIRELEKHVIKSKVPTKEFHIFFTHFHYDHISGFLYFKQLYNPDIKVHIYSPYPDTKALLENFMVHPYHPVGFDSFQADIEFHILQKQKVKIGSVTIEYLERTHPGTSHCYKVTENGRSFILSTDTQLEQKDFELNQINRNFFYGVDIIAIDAQYTIDEAITKYDWGHSSYSSATNFARTFRIAKILLCHHDPWNSDEMLEGMLKAAKILDENIKFEDYGYKLEIDLAREGSEIIL